MSKALLCGLLAASALAGCSIERFAARAAGRALAGGGAAWSSDDDPELVREALPFALKTIESLLAAAPDDPGLLLAASSGFTQYAEGFLAVEADELESTDLAAATALRARAGRLLARATRYGVRGLEGSAPGFEAAMAGGGTLDAALARLDRDDAPLLYWTAASLGARISRAKDDAALAAELPTVERLMRRARELEPEYGDGAIADFYVVWEGRPPAAGGSPERARAELAESLRISGGRRAAPLVGYAESVCVGAQDRAGFVRTLEQALALDPDAAPEHRLANLVSQRRARWLLGRADELFVE